VQIVTIERIGDKVKQRIVREVGIAMNDEESSPVLFRPDELALSPEIICNELVHVQQSILIHKTNGAHWYPVKTHPARQEDLSALIALQSATTRKNLE